MIAVLILCHKNKEQVQRLVSKIKDKEVDIYIHADLKFQVNSFKNAKMINKRYDISWGNINIVNATIDSLKEIKNDKYTHYILLSGQDYPIVPIKNIVKFLKENPDKEFIDYTEIGNSENQWNQSHRYTYYHFNNNEILDKISRKIYNKRSFIKGYIPYGGSQWWMLTNKAIKYIIDTYEKLNLNKKFKYTSCMDEIIFQSILCNSNFKDNIVNNCYRYIDWSEHIKGMNKGNPKTLTIDDYNKIINSNMFFARKFDIDKDSNILDKIDEVLK